MPGVELRRPGCASCPPMVSATNGPERLQQGGRAAELLDLVSVANSRRELSSDPIGELDSAKLRLSGGYKRQLLDQSTEVMGTRIGADYSVVAHHPQVTFDDFVEGRPFPSCDFDGAVTRCS